MGGVARVEWLDGNIGLLQLRPVLFPPSIAGGELTAAMQLVARADALILDLRQTVGGEPGAVALLCSYLFDDEPVHLIDMYERDGDRTTQSWTLPYVPGARFGGTKPVYVLTSGTTFSGGEELAYDLQQHGRAVLVGERTRGGAHPRIGRRVHPHLEATIPTGRAIGPVSGANWEGVGVQPDIEVPAGQALERAHELARTAIRPVPHQAGPVAVPAGTEPAA
jgi:C-terminal processing protease CtpA/Prc